MAESAFALATSAEEDWPEQGSWTWDDYLRLPDDGNRYEIIRGNLYVSPAPVIAHQFIVAALIRHLGNFASRPGKGLVLGAPLDVLLPGITSPIQPDVVFFLPGNLPDLSGKNFKGVPDVVVEVLSPGTRREDRSVKFTAYEDAGVAELWLVDPQTGTASVYGSDASGSYRAVGRFRKGERLRSRVIEGFELDLDEVFPIEH